MPGLPGAPKMPGEPAGRGSGWSDSPPDPNPPPAPTPDPQIAAIAARRVVLRFALVTVPALVAGAAADRPVSWRRPMPDAGYDVEWSSQQPVTVTVSTATPAGCVLTLTATAATTGGVLTAIGYELV